MRKNKKVPKFRHLRRCLGYSFHPECCFRFYAVVSVLCEKTMKNPLFRAYYEETAGIEQDWYQKMWLYHFFDTEKIILVTTLVC